VTVDWDERFEELRAFEKKQGHCRVPQAKKGTDTYQLALWVKLQRKGYKFFQLGKKSTITQGRIQRLNGVGFVWFLAAERVSWDERLEELKTFQLIHGHCRVPRSKLSSETYELANLGNVSTTAIYVCAARQETAKLGRKKSKVE
jgi:hypothetical protein